MSSIRIALILPYFGKLPNYFQLWLNSAGYNNRIDFLVFTDDDTSNYVRPHNVFFISKDLTFIKERIEKILPYDFVLHKPYKICDYRPLYGLIFAEYLSEYDFWGHCDPDVIWGDLSLILDKIDFNVADRINERGHLCIYRNTEKVNKAILQPCSSRGITSKDVFTHKYCAHFDEAPILNKYLQQARLKLISENAYADIAYSARQFISVTNVLFEEIACFEYSVGKLIGKVFDRDHDLIKEKSYAYVHLQKREMKVEISIDSDHYFIVPNAFVNMNFFPNGEINKQNIVSLISASPDYERKMRKQLLERRLRNVADGALFFRFKRLFE